MLRIASSAVKNLRELAERGKSMIKDYCSRIDRFLEKAKKVHTWHTANRRSFRAYLVEDKDVFYRKGFSGFGFFWDFRDMVLRCRFSDALDMFLGRARFIHQWHLLIDRVAEMNQKALMIACGGKYKRIKKEKRLEAWNDFKSKVVFWESGVSFFERGRALIDFLKNSLRLIGDFIEHAKMIHEERKIADAHARRCKRGWKMVVHNKK